MIWHYKNLAWCDVKIASWKKNQDFTLLWLLSRGCSSYFLDLNQPPTISCHLPKSFLPRLPETLFPNFLLLLVEFWKTIWSKSRDDSQIRARRDWSYPEFLSVICFFGVSEKFRQKTKTATFLYQSDYFCTTPTKSGKNLCIL